MFTAIALLLLSAATSQGVECEVKHVYMSNVTISQPKLCERIERIRLPCSEGVCRGEEERLEVCEGVVKKEVGCRGCSEELVLQRCENCDSIIKHGCENGVLVYDEEECEPCDMNESERVVLPFSDDIPAVRNIRCFAAFFEEEECNGVSEACRMSTRGFNSVTCAWKVCGLCQKIGRLRVSRSLQRYCRYLNGGSCTRLWRFGVRKFGGMSRFGSVTREVHDDNLLQERDDSDKAYVGAYGNNVCVDGCKRRVLGCGVRKKICKGDSDSCHMSFVQRFVCGKKSSRRILCDGDACVKDVKTRFVCGSEQRVVLGRVDVKSCP